MTVLPTQTPTSARARSPLTSSTSFSSVSSPLSCCSFCRFLNASFSGLGESRGVLASPSVGDPGDRSCQGPPHLLFLDPLRKTASRIVWWVKRRPRARQHWEGTPGIRALSRALAFTRVGEAGSPTPPGHTGTSTQPPLVQHRTAATFTFSSAASSLSSSGAPGPAWPVGGHRKPPSPWAPRGCTARPRQPLGTGPRSRGPGQRHARGCDAETRSWTRSPGAWS